MGRSEFCRSHGMGLSTLTRYLKKQQNRQSPAGSNGVEQGRLVAVELAGPVAAVSGGEVAGVLTVLLSNRRRVEVGPRESGRLRWLAELWPHYSIFVQGRSGNESRAFLVKG